ncbi:MAG: hypothetical protein K0R34_1088 [Herbinix sp.]|nr:hypothetical protein [Herbinix sp.]
MSYIKNNIYMILNGVYLVITLLFDVFAYGRLPGTITTQFSFRGEAANTMPKLTYMLVTAGIILLLFLLGRRRERMVQIKYLAANTILVIANIVMLALQL